MKSCKKLSENRNGKENGTSWKILNFLWKPKWKWATSICGIAVGWEFSSKTMSPTDFKYALKSAFFLPPSMESAYTSKSATFMRTYIKLTPHVLKGCRPCRWPQNNKNTDIESLMYRICWPDQLSWEHSQQFFFNHFSCEHSQHFCIQFFFYAPPMLSGCQVTKGADAHPPMGVDGLPRPQLIKQDWHKYFSVFRTFRPSPPFLIYRFWWHLFDKWNIFDR